MLIFIVQLVIYYYYCDTCGPPYQGSQANQRLSFHSVELIILNGLYKTDDNQCIVYK